jgi:hypothetical protein
MRARHEKLSRFQLLKENDTLPSMYTRKKNHDLASSDASTKFGRIVSFLNFRDAIFRGVPLHHLMDNNYQTKKIRRAFRYAEARYIDLRILGNWTI